MFGLAESRWGDPRERGDTSMTDSGPANTDPRSALDEGMDTEPPRREHEHADDRAVVRDPDTGHVSEEPAP